MKTKLDRLLDSISPEKVIEQTYNRANEAINTFGFRRAKVDQWDQFRGCMSDFLRHLDYCILRLKKPIDVSTEDYWTYCIRPLLKIYGIHGEKAAFEMVRTGNEGGLYAVLKAFAMQKAEEYSNNEIASRTGIFWESLSTDEKFTAMKEYSEKYGHLFPSELTEKGAVRIKGNFLKVLQKHPFMVQDLRRTGH